MDDMLFVFDAERAMAHALNAAAARLFLSLPDTFASLADIGAQAALPLADLHDSLTQWEALGWVESDAAGRIRLRPSRRGADDARCAAPTPPAREEARQETRQQRREELLQHCQVRLADRSVALRLLAAPVPKDDEAAIDPDGVAARRASGERLMGFFGGFADPAPAHHAPLATIDLVLEADGFTLRCGARQMFTPDAARMGGKFQLWLLELVYRDPPPSIFVHAAVLATSAGSMMLAGVSGAGKSTLAACLVARGWRFGTDDSPALGFVDGEARVLPCPGAINLKPGSLAPLATYYPGLAALPLVGMGEKRGRYLVVPRDRHLPAAGPENRLACFVFPRFRAGSPTRVEPIGVGEALLALMEAEFGLGEEAGATEIDAFFDTLERRPRYAIVYSDLAEMEAVLRRLVAGEAPEPQSTGTRPPSSSAI